MDTDLADVARRLLETAKRLDTLPASAVTERLDLREQLRALQARARVLQDRVSVDLTGGRVDVDVDPRRRHSGPRQRHTASEAELARDLAELRQRLAETEPV
jgi:hypothetical protein